MTDKNSKYHILKNIFGFNNFRDFQEEAVDAILDGEDLLMVLPTGGGKSLAYQLPTLMMRGVTVVISPLLALMQDQVLSLKSQQIKAEMISSMQNGEEIKEIMRNLLRGEISFLYLSPERLNNGSMYDLLDKVDINFFVIDEAHCISEWGHEFRSDYRSLSNLKSRYPNTSITAFTATAVSRVREDIARELCMENQKMISGNVFRKNLFISAQYRIKNGHNQLLEFLKDYQDKNGIVYVSSRKK